MKIDLVQLRSLCAPNRSDAAELSELLLNLAEAHAAHKALSLEFMRSGMTAENTLRTLEAAQLAVGDAGNDLATWLVVCGVTEA